MLAGCLLSVVSCGQEEQPEVRASAGGGVSQYALQYSAGTNGSVDGATHQTVNHGADGIEVTAVADEGYHFTTWSDGLATAKRADRKISGPLEVVANFSLNQYTLAYTVGDNGFIEGPASQSLDHGTDGKAVTAVPVENHHFTAWSDGLTSPVRTDLAVTADISVTAGFETNSYTLTYVAGEHGVIDGPGQQTVAYGKDGKKVTAAPDAGYHFTAWSDGLNTPTRNDRKVVADLKVTAGFEPNLYTLTYQPDKHGRIEGESQQDVIHGEKSSEVVAVAEPGYHFAKWSDGLDTARRIDAQVTGDLVVNAVFAINTYTVGGTVSGLVEGTTLTLQNNAGDDLVINADGSFSFSGELLDSKPYEVTVKTQPVSPNQTCTVTAGSGEITGANVTDVEIYCVLNTYMIGGMVNGLADDDQIVLQNNSGDDLLIKANGTFSFASPLEDGSSYEISVSSPPGKPNWTCDLGNATGTLAGSDVGDVTVSCYVKAVLLATPSLRKIKLDWNSYDFSTVTFHLCSAQGNIPETEIGDCQETEDVTYEQEISPPHTVAGLINDVPYWFRLEVLSADGHKTYSDVIQSMAFGGLNDTGVDWCADNLANRQTDGTRTEMAESCRVISETHPGQDAHHGRDALARASELAKTGHGNGGFDFTKVCRNGKVAGERGCPPNPSIGDRSRHWGCTRDNVTGLVWEVKTASGLHAYENTYSWYNPDEAVNGGDAGMKNGGRCQESSCDTHVFVEKVNESGLCGISDWRLPTRKELLSIVDNSSLKPAVDLRFFPNTVPSYYWSASPYADQAASSWQVYFHYGEASPYEKTQGRHVRLVSGRTMTFGLSAP